METVAKRQNCGIPPSPLSQNNPFDHDEAEITPKVDPSTGDLNALIRAGHPGVTLA